MTLLCVRGLRAGYGDRVVVEGASFEVDAGEVVLIVGGNGSGKSTLLKALVGLSRTFSVDEVRFLGREVALPLPLSGDDASVAMIPQTQPIFGSLTVAENLELASQGVANKMATIAAGREELARAGIPLSKTAGLLSGGQRKMLAILMGAVRRPELLLLDEPLVGLDLGACDRVLAYVSKIIKTGVGMVIVEHRYGNILPICQRVIALKNGVISEVIERPSSVEPDELERRIDASFFG